MNIVDALKSKKITRKLSNGLTEVKEFHNNWKIYKHYFLDENDKLHGEHKRWWYRNGTLSEHCYYEHGKLHGEYKWWLKDGTLYEYSHWKNGKLIKDYLKDK